MKTKFTFYLSYADIIGEMTDTEAGTFIKKLCRLVFMDEQPEDDTAGKITSILILLSEELKSENAPRRREKSFTFLRVYANLFYSLNDTKAGLLIKMVCDFMFGGNRTEGKDTKKVSGCFNILKKELTKNKNKAEARKKPYSITRIYRDFPDITKLSEPDKALADKVNMRELYEYIASDKTLQGEPLADIIRLYTEEQRWKKNEVPKNYDQD